MVTFFQFLSKKQNDNLKLENMFNDYRLCGHSEKIIIVLELIKSKLDFIDFPRALHPNQLLLF